MVGPLKKIYKRMEISFASKATGDTKSQADVTNAADDNLDSLFEQIEQLGTEINSDISDELSLSKKTARQRLFSTLDKAIKDIKNPSRENDGYVWNTKYTFDEEKFNRLVVQVTTRVNPIFKDGKVINKDEVKHYKKALAELRSIIADLSKQTPITTSSGWSIFGKLMIFDILLQVVDDFAEPLQKYTVIIDKKILELIRLIGLLAKEIGKRVDAKIQDQELTLMFTALIPLIVTCATVTKTYQWATKKNYTPIRLALADVNALLIESTAQLDDHDYGKLVYLICKLRNKAKSLKHALSSEFLADVAKLESKRYSAQTKRAIVENMFNKYVFLGRVTA
jgi:hypothetical protein